MSYLDDWNHHHLWLFLALFKGKNGVWCQFEGNQANDEFDENHAHFPP